MNDDLRKRIDELQAEMKKFKAVFLKQENRIRVLENKVGELTGTGGVQTQQQVSFITRVIQSIKSFTINMIFIIILLNALYYYFRYLLKF